MTFNLVPRLARLLLILTAFGITSTAPFAQTPSQPAGAAATGVMPLDLNTGKVDTTPLAQTAPLTNEAFDPQTPPQTVEGTLVSLDEERHVAVIRTKRNGDVKVGLPPDVYVSRKSVETSISAMKPGDRIWATVETAHGVRAIRIAFAPPSNPLISWIGIPVLLIIAFILWWTGRKQEIQEERVAAA